MLQELGSVYFAFIGNEEQQGDVEGEGQAPEVVVCCERFMASGDSLGQICPVWIRFFITLNLKLAPAKTGRLHFCTILIVIGVLLLAASAVLVPGPRGPATLIIGGV